MLTIAVCISKCQLTVIVYWQSEQELYQCPLASYINNQTVWEKYAKSSQLLTACIDKYESSLIVKKNSAKIENSMNICPRGACSESHISLKCQR